jgi:beta-lactamase regulating signal transducer with metallopeptidase domain
MIAAWMLAATALGLLATGAALAVERALRLLHRQGRSAWILALLLTCAWPVIAPALRRPVDQSVQVVGTPVGMGGTLTATDMPIAPLLLMRDRLAPLDSPLLVVWAVTSALLLAYATAAFFSLSRLARGAEPRTLDGRAVLLTPAIGPAAFGIIRPRILLPSWSLELDRPMRELVLRHEVEHIASSDPAMLVLAWLLTALMPWNLSLWWILRRLRTATELDCDYRVLHGTADTRRYAHLLLLIAQRQGQATFASMIAGSPSTLSERITAMHAVPPTRPVLRAAALLIGALIVGAAAASPALARELANVRDRVAPARPAAVVAEAPRVVVPPNRPSVLSAATAPAARAKSAPKRSLATQVAASSSEAVVAQDTVKKTVTVRTVLQLPGKKSVSDSQVVFARGSAAPRYPEILKQAGVTGKTVVQFVVDSTGLPIVSTLKVVRSAHELFTVAVQKSLPDHRFLPALVGGHAVRQLVQVVYRFEILGVPFTDTTAVPSGAVRTLEVVITGNVTR